MSDLKPHGVEIEIEGRKSSILFTIDAIEEIQEACNMPLIDAVGYVAKAADRNTDKETFSVFFKVAAILLGDPEMAEREARELIGWNHYARVAFAILEAYGITIPDPDEDDDLEDEEEVPNAETGR